MLIKRPERFQLSRRTMLRGLAGGTAVALALPPLEAMLDAHGEAWADGTELPRRLVTWFWGNGVALSNVDNPGGPLRFAPAQTGSGYALTPQLQPFEMVRDHVSVLSGYQVSASMPSRRGHHDGTAIFSGHPFIELPPGAANYASKFGGPTVDQVVAEEVGSQTYLPSVQLRVSKRIRLQDSLIGTGFPFRKGDNFQRYLKMFEEVMVQCAGVRRPGAAALDLCYVAAGFYDGFFETGLSPWDIAAGSLMITEAGGLVGNFTGEPDFLYQREIVAGNPRIYGQLVKTLSPYTRVIKEDPKVDAELEADDGESDPEDDALIQQLQAAEDAAQAEKQAAEPEAAKPQRKRITAAAKAQEDRDAAEREPKRPGRPARRDDAPF